MESCVQNPLMPRVHGSRRTGEIKWISFEDVMQRSYITAFKMDESRIGSHKPKDYVWMREREIFFLIGFQHQCSLKNVKSTLNITELLTLSQLARIGDHRAID